MKKLILVVKKVYLTTKREEMLSAIGKLFNWEAEAEAEADDGMGKDLMGVPLAKDFSVSDNGIIRYRDESYDPPVIMSTGADYICKRYPEIWSFYQPNSQGCVNFLMQMEWPNGNVGNYQLGMSVENMSNMLEVIDDQNFQNDGYRWKIVRKNDLSEDDHVYDFRIFMNDFMYYYFNFGFMHDLINPIKLSE